MICLSDWQKLKKDKISSISKNVEYKVVTQSRHHLQNFMHVQNTWRRPASEGQGLRQYSSFALSGASGSFAQSWWEEEPFVEIEILTNQWDGKLRV